MSRGSVRRVLKLGGSLLSRGNWRASFAAWYQAPSSGTVDVMIVGGGRQVERLRELSAEVALDDYAAHWAAIGFMSANARWFAASLDCPLVETLDGLPATSLCVLDPALLLQSQRIQLEASWRVTSDSIAAAVAKVYAAQELMLLKSAAPPSADFGELARAGYVDECFPAIAESLERVSFVALESGKGRESISAKTFTN